MIELFTAATPNGQKISIALEELDVPYKLTSISLQENKQKEPSFLDINPNGRIPAIVDHNKSSGFPVFESGAILLYLTDHYDPAHRLGFAPEDWECRSELLQWLFFQNAGIGPMQGQANHFFRYAKEKIPYAIERYQTETRRLYGVLEERLTGQGHWLVGNKYTIADISCFAWVRWAAWAGVEMVEFPNVREWAERIEEREAVKRGLKVPDAEDTIERLRKGDEQDEWGDWVKGQK